MKNSFKKQILGALLLVSATTLTSCGDDKNQIVFWSSFGTTYTNALDSIVEDVKAEMADEKGNPLNLAHKDQGSYDKIKSNMEAVVKSKKYPNVLIGYPDHFAGYAGKRILEPLDGYIERFNQKYGVDIMNEDTTSTEYGGYYEAYQEENRKIDVDAEHNPIINGLPFNKSTELMGYNGVFVDYCVDYCAKNPNVTIPEHPELGTASTWDLGKVPETWQEWSDNKGPEYRYILDTLIGKKVYGVQNYEGTASGFSFVETGAEGEELLIDLSNTTRDETRVIGWDSTDNMFISILYLWGGKYTTLPKTEYVKSPNNRIGEILFTATDYEDENHVKHNYQATAVEAIRFFANLNDECIFGDSSRFDGESYCSGAFEVNKVMFMICSSGGLSYNTTKWTNRFRCAPVPYYDDGKDIRKEVISQGANITLTKQKNGDKEKAFEFMVRMTSAEHQAEWCLTTGYFPASSSAQKTEQYQRMLNEEERMIAEGTPEKAFQNSSGEPAPLKVAYREAARDVNTANYMDKSKGWHKFVDDPFVGSSTIRSEVKDVIPTIFGVSEGELTDAKIISVLKDKAQRAKNQNNRNIKID